MISIAICTHDRSEDVASCLSALATQLDGRSDEVIVIDSGSADLHARALAAVAGQYRARLVRLEQPGLSLARNTALRLARGEWVAFLDDDTVPFDDWLSSLQRTLDSAPDALAGVGGRTEPLWPRDVTPRQVSQRWLFFLSCIQETHRGSAREGANVCGANLTFRKCMLLEIGGFLGDLGRMGDRLIGGEESLAIKLLLRNGWDVVYEPSIRVNHRIHRERLTLPWMSKRAYWEGVTEIAMLRAIGERFPARLALPKLAISSFVMQGLFYVTRNPDFLIRARMAAGALAARLQRPNGPVPPLRAEPFA